MTAKKTTIYVYPLADSVLNKLMKERNESQSAIVNSAIIFDAERSQYMADIIKKNIREALSE